MRVEVGTLSLPELVGSLVKASRHKLGLSEAHQNQQGPVSALDESTDQEGVETKVDSNVWKSLLPSELGVSLDRGLDGTLASSMASTGGPGLGFLAEISGVDEGVIHFAGVESDLEQTQTLANGKGRQKLDTEQAYATLCTSLAMLLSTDKFIPGNGMYPSDAALTSKEIALYNIASERAGHQLVSAFVSAIFHQAAPTTAPQSLEADFLASLSSGALSALKLMLLDSIAQSHFSLAVALVNAFSWLVLSECTKTRQKLLDVQGKEENLQSLREFSDLITSAMSTTSSFISEALSQLDEVYSSDMATPDSSIPTGFRLEGLPSADKAVASNLAVPLLSLAKLTSAFSTDIESFMNSAQELVPCQVSSRLQGREFELLYRNLANSNRQAMSVLENVNAKVSNTLQALAVVNFPQQPAETGTEEYVSERQFTGKPITSEQQHQQQQRQQHQQRQLQEEQQNQQISLVLEPSPKGSEHLTVLLRRLEQYDLKGALELAHSVVAQPSGSDAQSVHSNSVFQRKLLDCTRQSGELSRTKSLSSLYQEEPQSLISANNPLSKVAVELSGGVAAVSCLARFMVRFFVNAPLLHLPSTATLAILSTLNPPGSSGALRYVELDRTLVTKAVRDQKLSTVWTADQTLRLLLICGLWEEACNFVSTLGDWRKAFLIACLYLCHDQKMSQVYSDLQAPQTVANLKSMCHQLAVTDIVSQLSCSQSNVSSQGNSDPPAKSHKLADYECLDIMEPPRADVLHAVSSSLQACAVVELDSPLITSLHTLIFDLEAVCKQLPVLVSSAVYLPAPPLYCLQPGVPNEVRWEAISCNMNHMEYLLIDGRLVLRFVTYCDLLYSYSYTSSSFV